MWVRTMANPGAATIKRMAMAPVAVDTNVRRVTLNLGVVAKTRESARGRAIQSAWRDAVTAGSVVGPPGISGTCAPIDPALWFFGKYELQSLRDNRESGTDRLSLPILPLGAITRTRLPGLEG